MNNGRILTLFDLGRFDLSIRTGLSKILRQNRWGLAVAGGSARYRKRVRMLDKVTMRTQLAGVDDKWFFVSQSMWVKGQPTSSALLRTCITKGGRALPSSEVLDAMGLASWPHALPAWVAEWSEADATRPWPPEP